MKKLLILISLLPTLLFGQQTLKQVANIGAIAWTPIGYNANYGLRFTSRSMVDKGYVDSVKTTISSGLTVGTTAIASGATLKLLYDNAGVLGESGIIGDANGNLTLGVNAGYVSSVNGNTFVGVGAANAITTGYDNAAFGWTAMNKNTTGFHNTAIGAEVLYTNTTGNNNTGIGQASLYANTSGTENTATGRFSSGANTTGSDNSSFGYYAGYGTTTGSDNESFGAHGLYANTTGSKNIAIGTNALQANTTGISNIAIGYQTLSANVGATHYNTAIGYQALQNNTTGSNIAIGKNTLSANTTGDGNIAIGREALSSNIASNNNCAIGDASLTNNTSGTRNISVGANSLTTNTTGQYNVVMGTSAGYNLVGSYNTLIGDAVMYPSTTGDENACFGNSSRRSATGGNQNTIIGTGAGYGNVTGSANIALGYYAGAYVLGSDTMVIDNRDRTNNATMRTNALIIGKFAAAPANQTLLVNGLLQISQGSPGVGKVLTSDANGLGSWSAIGVPVTTRVSTQFDKTTNTTLANVTGLTATLLAGQTYQFEATLYTTKDAVGGEKYTIASDGTLTATAVIFEILAVDNTGNLNTITARQTALGSSSGQASGTTGFTKITGTITVNVGGVMSVQFAQNASNGTSSILVGSTFRVTQIN